MKTGVVKLKEGLITLYTVHKRFDTTVLFPQDDNDKEKWDID